MCGQFNIKKMKDLNLESAKYVPVKSEEQIKLEEALEAVIPLKKYEEIHPNQIAADFLEKIDAKLEGKWLIGKKRGGF